MDTGSVEEMRREIQALAALPADRPFGLPGRFYTDPDYFRHQCANVLRRGWHCIGRTDEIPEPGNFFTAQILNEPLLVVRGDDGEIRAFANLCRHRGMPLAEGRGSAKRFVCSYHAWAYRRDGTLHRAPRMENAGFDPRTCRLHMFPLQTRHGFLYVALEAGAQAFGAESAALDTHLAPYEPESFRLVHTAEETWRTNWKCLVENFMEGYHLSVVHPETLHGYTPTGLATKAVSGPGFTSYNANYPDKVASRGYGAPGLTAEQRHRSTLFARFPTQVTSQAASLLVSLMLFPRAVDEITVKWTLSVHGDDLDEETIAQRIALWEEVNREDREKLERLQVSLGSAHAGSGPLARDDYEGTIRDFLLWLAHQDRAEHSDITAA